MRRSSDVGPDVARARARYEAARTILVGLLVVIILGVLGLLVVVALENRDQGRQIAQLLERQERNDAEEAAEDAARQGLIDDAVGRIAAEQYRALVAHDRRVEALLRRNTVLLDSEVNAPRNQERQVAPIPPPIPPPITAAPAPRPKVGPPTGAAPAPAPAPCETRGKSGKCRK